jgi:hypothetical protein
MKAKVLIPFSVIGEGKHGCGDKLELVIAALLSFFD